MLLTDAFSKYKSEYFLKQFQVNQGASVVLLDKDHVYFVLTKMNKWKHHEDKIEIKYSGIGGAIENGETPFECLERELKEEIGLSIKELSFIKPIKVKYIKPDNKIQEFESKEEDILPLCIFEREFPLREDIIISRRNEYKGSCLQLFIYTAYSNNRELRIRESEIPALLKIKKKAINDFIQKDQLFDSKQGSDVIDVIENRVFVEKYGSLPSKVLFKAQFTPCALKMVKEDFINILQ